MRYQSVVEAIPTAFVLLIRILEKQSVNKAAGLKNIRFPQGFKRGECVESMKNAIVFYTARRW